MIDNLINKPSILSKAGGSRAFLMIQKKPQLKVDAVVFVLQNVEPMS